MNNEQQQVKDNTNTRISTNDQASLNSNGMYSADRSKETKKQRFEKPLKIFGTICIVTTILTMMFSHYSKVDTSDAAKSALRDKVSSTISAGTVLLSKDQNIGSKDYTITHKSSSPETKIWIWDYAAEDGDYVQLFVNGSPVSDAFMIKNAPKAFIVPATGEVQVKCIKDGGGGITYAVRFEANATSYFNGAPEGDLNTYTLKKE